MDDSSFDWAESLIKTITLPRQAYFHFQPSVSDNAEAVCKVRYYYLKDYHKGLFTNYVYKILAIFDHLPLCIDIFY